MYITTYTYESEFERDLSSYSRKLEFYPFPKIIRQITNFINDLND